MNGTSLPTPRALREAMVALGCRVSPGGWCRTHGSSLMIHDGGRVACAAAWKVQP